MTKSELISEVAAKTGMTKKESDTAVNAVIDAIISALASGEKVQIVGFGTFEVKTRAEHVGRNPYTGEPMTIAASKHVTFSAGKTLKETLKSSSGE
ncbi:MAG TPA: HU family DNA-binding protein [Bacillota bacterium]|nr:HU family DNA-binding protein [Bacillota bacterium]